MRRMAWVMTLWLVIGVQPAWAGRTQVHEAAESMDYGRKFGGMIGRGLLNVVTSFVDVIVNVVNETRTGPPFVGTLTGVARGTGCGVLRLGSGAVDLTTFWVPGFNGFPVSASYDNCLTISSSAESAGEHPPGYGMPSATWEVPTTEPGAAQAPVADSSRPAKKAWKK